MAQVTGLNSKSEPNHNNNNHETEPGKFSLLRPSGLGQNEGNTQVVPDEADLGLVSIIRALDVDGRHYQTVSNILGELNSNPAIISYRQDTLYELLRLPDLVEQFSEVLPQLIELASTGRSKGWGDSLPLPQIAARLAELEIYLNCVEMLWAALKNYDEGRGAQSAALAGLRARLVQAREDPIFQNLIVELPGLRSRLSQASSSSSSPSSQAWVSFLVDMTRDASSAVPSPACRSTLHVTSALARSLRCPELVFNPSSFGTRKPRILDSKGVASSRSCMALKSQGLY